MSDSLTIWISASDGLTPLDKLTLDVGYYLMGEFQTDGSSLASSLYSYDVVKWEEKADANGNVEWGAGENGV